MKLFASIFLVLGLAVQGGAQSGANSPHLAAANALLPAWGAAEIAPPAARLFAVVFRIGPAWDKTLPPPQQKHFKDHSQNLARLRSEGRMKLGGRFGEWGLVLIEAQDEAEARAQVDRDASVAAGVFSAEVHAWSTFAPGCVERAPAPSPTPAPSPSPGPSS